MQKRLFKNMELFKRPNYTIIIILTLGLLFGCHNFKSNEDLINPSIETIAAQKEAIKITLNSMWLAIENEDIKTYASYIHPSFSQFGEYDSIIKLGKETEVKGIHEWIKNSSNIHTEMIDPIVSINGNVAWITYYWSDHGISNGEPFASRGKSTRIFVKENNIWLCIHGHYTLLP